MSDIFHSYLIDPLFGFLLFIYNLSFVGSLGVAIIIFTSVIRLVLLPLFYKGARNQALIQRLQPEIEKIRKKYKDNREEQAKKLMDVYKKNKVNPFSGIFMLFFQIIIFFSLFLIFKNTDNIEAFSNPYFLRTHLVEPSIIFAVIVAFLQYVQAKISFGTKNSALKTGPMANFSKYMVYAIPGISFMVLTKFPAALAVYWGISTLFSVGQQYIINKKLDADEKEDKENEKEKKDNGKK